MSSLHPDFDGLAIEPGAAHPLTRPDLFDIVNLVAFGGAADHPTHVPTELGQVGPVVLWESTGAADALPFWNTNFVSDVYLYVVHGGVRVELKAVEGREVYGHYTARTGDLFRLPRDIAHRTYSLDGRRRISLEILERDPAWVRLGELADVEAAATATLGSFEFRLDETTVRVDSPGSPVEVDRSFFQRGLRALVAWELHLAHNEFEPLNDVAHGFVVHDRDDHVVLKAPGHAESFAPIAVMAAFRHLLGRLEPPSPGRAAG